MGSWVLIFLVQGRGLVFNPQGGASPPFPPPLPMCDGGVPGVGEEKGLI